MSMSVRNFAPHRSAFRGNALAFPSLKTAPLTRSARLLVENRTVWTLNIDQKWCDANQGKCEMLQPSIDLSKTISGKFECLVGETKNCDFAVSCGKTGVEVKFESVGAANPVDSPAELYLTDVGGTTPLLINDQELTVGDKVRLYPGNKVKFGDFAQFQVLRNVEAHA